MDHAATYNDLSTIIIQRGKFLWFLLFVFDACQNESAYLGL
ncbi:hypothetical protein [Niallia sp. 03133]